MIKNDGTGRYTLGFESEGVIRRIPLERHGVSKRGTEWTLGGLLVEIEEDDCEGSAQLFLSTFNEELIEQINVIGVGKRVRLSYHIECKEYFDNYKTNIILDAIEGCTEGESFLYNTKKKGDKND